MADNPTVGYSIGVLEGYLESLVKDGQAGAEECLGYLKALENAYVDKASQLAVAEKKLADIRLNLEGWSRN